MCAAFCAAQVSDKTSVFIHAAEMPAAAAAAVEAAEAVSADRVKEEGEDQGTRVAIEVALLEGACVESTPETDGLSLADAFGLRDGDLVYACAVALRSR